MPNQISIISAITDVINRSSIYSESKGIIEVEKLYYIPNGLDDFKQKIPVDKFKADKLIRQEDSFFDIKLNDGRWQLSDTDHFIRIRKIYDTDGIFQKGEIKIGYPGLMSNHNIRFSPAEKLTEGPAIEWCRYLTFIGFEIERQYKKQRIPFISKQKYQNFDVELEVDRFDDNECNRKLAGISFSTISVETDGIRRIEAEQALIDAKKDIEKTGIILKECTGNYEDYFYCRKNLPT